MLHLLAQGARAVPGSSAEVGGRCVRAAKRRAWLTVLLSLCWLMLGSVLGAGSLWVWENKFRRSTVNAALYHELSMDTGF
jgi:hypothetical protein